MTAPERVESPLRRSARSAPAPADAVAPKAAGSVSAASVVSAGPVSHPPLPLRELTGWEEEYLERHQRDDNTARLCNEVLARCLVSPGQEPGDDVRKRVRGLLVAERDRELVRLRRMSLGADVSARVDCPECGTANEVDFSLDALALDFEVPAAEFEVELPGVGRVGMRLPTAGDQEDLLEIEAGLDTPAARRSWVLARCIRTFDDGEARVGLALDDVRGLPVAQRAALEAAIDSRLPQLDLEMALDCVNCRARFIAPFDVAIFFFRNEASGAGNPAHRAPAGTGLPLGRAGHPGPAAGAPAQLPDAARGGRRRRPVAGSDRRRRVLVSDSAAA